MIQCQYVTVTNLPGTVDHRWHGVVNRYGPQTGWCRCVVRFGQMKRPRRGRRNRIHRFRVHQRPRHRPARRAARQGRPLPRRPVPTLALSPVLHQHRPTGTRGRHHPPPTRDHRTVFADLIDGPLAHLPSGRFGANSAWILCAAIAHNLLRAAGVLAGDQHARARGSMLRRKIINTPARLARPRRRPILHLPTHWPWSKHWLRLWHNTIGYSPPITI